MWYCPGVETVPSESPTAPEDGTGCAVAASFTHLEEEARLASQMAASLDALGDAFFALDKDWRVTLVNSSQERASQRRREDTLGHVCWEVWPETTRVGSKYWEEYHRCMEERLPVLFLEYSAPRDVWTEVRAFPTRDGGISVFSRDVSSEHQLIGVVSHDLRNPLQAISLSAALSLKSPGLDARQRRSFERIAASADRAMRMITALLDFTRVRLGSGIAIERGPVDLHSLVAQGVDEVLVSYPERHVSVEAVGDGRGCWDADRLSQVVQNLVGNALQHTTEDVAVRVRTRDEGPDVVLEVHNGGSPIAPEDLPRLFEPFQRGRNKRPEGGRSLGLGLHITYHLVQAHGGTVRVTSTAAEGTTFTVRLSRSGPASAADERKRG
ncbi:MAG: ATP-binding protein [Archangium sp.]